MYKIIGGDQREYGPVGLEQVKQWIQEGRANAQTLIQKEGGPWLPLSSLPECAAFLAPPPTPASVAAFPAPPPVPVPTLALPSDHRRIMQLVEGPAIALLITGIICALASVF